jgi:MFS family permease
MFLVLTTPVPWVPAVSFGIGLAHGLGYPAIGALAISLGDPRVRGRITAWLTGGFNLGFALSTAGFARFEPELGYRGLVGLGAFCLLLVALAVPLLVRNHDRRQSARRACDLGAD